ncbi:MAG: membrane protein insertase YidC [Candidatus Omnitrophica bacterium]|nr:membrane protein insertase YidC [Candidatus Omnitrophota bacterium]
MGKRALLAVFLSLLVITGYNYFLAQKYPSLNEQESQPLIPEQVSAPAFLEAPAGEESKVVATGSMFQEAKALQSLAAAEDIVVQTDLLRLVITSSGARIKSCQLRKYAEEKISIEAVQKQLLELEATTVAGSAQAQELLQRKIERQTVLLTRLMRQTEMAELVSLPAVADADFSPSLTVPEAEVNFDTVLYKSSKGSLTLDSRHPSGELEFTYSDRNGRQIVKTYSFSNSNYGIGLDIKFAGWNESAPDHFLISYGPDLGTPTAQRGRRMASYRGPLTCFQTGEQIWTQKEKYGRDEANNFVQREHRHKGDILWTGLENKYFLAALIPAQPAKSVLIEKNKFGEQKVALAIPWQNYGSYKFNLYLGPKKKEHLSEINATLGKVIDYGFFSPIARLIYQVLVFFSRWTHNFGWAIVLLCLITKVIFYPLTHRSFESMQKMQQEMKSIQPEMDALREKLKDTPQKLNKEIMELYKRKGVNPLSSCQSGCLPLLLQMPVFFALYGVLYNSIELRGTPFFGWITDLSAKDPYYVLPVLMGASMFVQQKLSGLSSAGGAQQDQAKMMAIMMPVLLTWIFSSLPSGVVLYWLTFNILTSAQQLLIKKKQQAVSPA